MKIFKATIDRRNIIWNYIVNILFITLFCICIGFVILKIDLFCESIDKTSFIMGLLMIICFSFAPIIFTTWVLIKPLHYVIDKDYISIKTIFYSNKILIKDIIQLHQIDISDFGELIKIRGLRSDSYVGIFKSTKFGKIIFRTTQMKNHILIETTEKKFIISPDNTDEFVNYFSNIKVIKRNINVTLY